MTYGAESNQLLARRGLGAANESIYDINVPPYTIHNGVLKIFMKFKFAIQVHSLLFISGFGRLSIHALATNATHAPGYAELDTHNLWGLMEERATHLAVADIIPGKRPFLISRSTFPSSGIWSGHWVSIEYSRKR